MRAAALDPLPDDPRFEGLWIHVHGGFVLDPAAMSAPMSAPR